MFKKILINFMMNHWSLQLSKFFLVPNLMFQFYLFFQLEWIRLRIS